MLAHVPSIPSRLGVDHDVQRSHVWTIVLTGDAPPTPTAGMRRRSCRPTSHWSRPPAPGARRTLERASRLAPIGQMLTVLTRRQAAAWAKELEAVPDTRRIVQPVYRGRAAEMLLPLLTIAGQDPSATVIVLPADQPSEHDARFLRYVRRAVWAVALRPDVPILIGAHPYAAVADGWIEPGAPVEGLEDLAVHTVRRFVNDATPPERRALFDAGALVSTSIFVARAGTLLSLAQRALPEVLEALEPLEAAFGRPEEGLLCEAVYECMPRAGLGPLESAPELAVLGLPDVVWQAPEREALELIAS
jgi:mannose-1-phosphate guanylyltransferase